LLCLGQEHSADLRAVLRDRSAAPAALEQAIRTAIELKPRGHDFRLDLAPVILRHMNVTGG
jgi:cyclic pyranopterin phosphate synthase